DKSLLVHRRPPLPVSVFYRNRMGNQGREESPDAEESQLQRYHHGVLEFLRRYLQARPLDALGDAELRKRPAHADHGHGPRSLAGAFSQRAHRNGLFEPMKSAPTSKKASALASELLPEREPRRIADTVLHLLKSTAAEDTEVHVDEVANALTRFANNAIHQNVAEHGLTVSIRTVVDSRTARATTNRIDEDSLRATIEASLSLAHSQPKVPNLLPMPGKQRYPTVNRFVKKTAALSAEDRARPGHPRTRRRARSRRLSLLRFRSHRARGQTLLPQRTHGQATLRPKYQHHRRRLSSATAGRPVRWRRAAAPACCAGRSRHPQESRLFTR